MNSRRFPNLLSRHIQPTRKPSIPPLLQPSHNVVLLFYFVLFYSVLLCFFLFPVHVHLQNRPSPALSQSTRGFSALHGTKPFSCPVPCTVPTLYRITPKSKQIPPNPLIFNQKKARLTRAFTQGERNGDFKALRVVLVCPVFVYRLQKMKKKAGEVGKTSPAVLLWEPSELKKERTSFFAAVCVGSGPAARVILHFLRAETRKKKGEIGEKMKKKHRKRREKVKKALHHSTLCSIISTCQGKGANNKQN